MFADYQSLIMEDYHRQKVNNLLPINLSRPTPARLKEECEQVCTKRFERNDERVISDFFGKANTPKEYIEAIQLCKPGRFKPLINFLEGETKQTDEKNIQLLAWLIDFKDRPYDYTRIYRPISDARVRTSGEGDKVDVPPIPGGQPPFKDKEGLTTVPPNQGERDTVDRGKQPDENSGAETLNENVKSKWQTRSSAIAVILLSIIGAGGYWWLNNQGGDGSGACMYWAGDHYEAVVCSPRPDKALVVPLDSVLVKYFRKITVPDTITNRAKGRVWYSKINNKVEFYTSDGYHPIVTSHRLKPLTDYIIEKYIYPGMTSN